MDGTLDRDRPGGIRKALALLRRAAGPEATALFCGLFVIAGTWGLIELADEVREGSTLNFDRWSLRALRTEEDPARPIGPDWLPEAARDITSLGSGAVLGLLTVGVLVLLVLCRRYRMAVFLAIAVAGGEAASQALKALFARPRPDVVPHLVRVLGKSFPSGHAMLSAVAYLTLGALTARLSSRWTIKAYLLGTAGVLAFLVGASRIYLGVHYPTDVLAGWTAGLVWAALCALAAKALQRRGKIGENGA